MPFMRPVRRGRVAGARVIDRVLAVHMEVARERVTEVPDRRITGRGDRADEGFVEPGIVKHDTAGYRDSQDACNEIKK